MSKLKDKWWTRNLRGEIKIQSIYGEKKVRHKQCIPPEECADWSQCRDWSLDIKNVNLRSYDSVDTPPEKVSFTTALEKPGAETYNTFTLRGSRELTGQGECYRDGKKVGECSTTITTTLSGDGSFSSKDIDIGKWQLVITVYPDLKYSFSFCVTYQSKWTYSTNFTGEGDCRKPQGGSGSEQVADFDYVEGRAQVEKDGRLTINLSKADTMNPQLHLSGVLTLSELEAVISASKTTVTRGDTLTLDASQSRGGDKIDKYIWQLTALEPLPEGVKLSKACICEPPGIHFSLQTSEAKPPELSNFTVLVPFKVSLVVQDREGSWDPADPVTIQVKPRTGKAWKTPCSHTSNKTFNPNWPAPKVEEDPRTKDLWFYAEWAGNRCAKAECAHTESKNGVLHPHGIVANTWSDNQSYTATQVKDPAGGSRPFSGCWYVERVQLEVARESILNAFIRKQSSTPYGADVNIYTANKKNRVNMEQFLQKIEEHEGWGVSGKNGTGHSQMYKTALTKNNGENDPRKQLEQIFGEDESDLRKRIDAKLREIETALAAESNDPLATIWSGTFYFYDPLNKKWVKNPQLTVPQQ